MKIKTLLLLALLIAPTIHTADPQVERKYPPSFSVAYLKDNVRATHILQWEEETNYNHLWGHKFDRRAWKNHTFIRTNLSRALDNEISNRPLWGTLKFNTKEKLWTHLGFCTNAGYPVLLSKSEPFFFYKHQGDLYQLTWWRSDGTPYFPLDIDFGSLLAIDRPSEALIATLSCPVKQKCFRYLYDVTNNSILYENSCSAEDEEAQELDSCLSDYAQSTLALFQCSDPRTLVIYNYIENRIIRLELPETPSCLALSPEGDIVAVGFVDGWVFTFDTTILEVCNVQEASPSPDTEVIGKLTISPRIDIRIKNYDDWISDEWEYKRYIGAWIEQRTCPGEQVQQREEPIIQWSFSEKIDRIKNPSSTS